MQAVTTSLHVCVFHLLLHLHWFQESWVSMGVYSDGSYGVQPGLIYSFPVTCEKGEWTIVKGTFSSSSSSSSCSFKPMDSENFSLCQPNHNKLMLC